MGGGGKSAVVTGGERGIGLAVTRGLVAAGYQVLVAGIDEAAATHSMAEFSDEWMRFQRCDVGDEPAVGAAMAHVLEWTGRLDLLVCNAAIADPGGEPPEALSLENWERVIRTNLTGAFLCAKHAMSALRVSRGSIVLIASTRAMMSEPHTEAYAASKGGLVSLAHALAMSAGPAVRVNSISPGWIHCGEAEALTASDHDQHPVGRVGNPKDIADAILYLAEAGFVTGENLVVDGGMTRKMIYR